MKLFPKYRIPVIIGWIIPPLISFLVLREIPIHLVLKIVIFPILAMLTLFAEVLIAMRLGEIWNKWQRNKENRNTE